MIEYVRGIDQLPKGTRLAVTVGVFDGVHRGHQQVFRVLEETARRLGAMPVAVTFDPHPEAVVTGRAPDMLMDRLERIERISRHIGGLVVLQTFDEVFRRTTAQEFVDRLGGKDDLAALVMTSVSAFGRDRGGTLPVLREMGAAGGWELVDAPTLDSGGDRVSSARTRQLVTNGELRTAADLLSRPFALVGSVVHGEQRGRELGFPTANLDFSQPVALPPDGIYAARASWGGPVVLEPGEMADAVVSLGTQPTFGGRVRLMEAHLLDRDEDLYGQRMRVQFCTFIRGQERFDSSDELVSQMGHDVARARTILDECETC
jgi:riboflavin kinase/FMN adenylyltransferase